MILRLFAISLLVTGPVLGADLADLERLLEQAATSRAGTQEPIPTSQAQRELLRQYARATDAVRDAFAARLAAALADPRPAMRVAAARTIAVRPTADDVEPLLDALQTEGRRVVRGVLARSVARSVGRIGPAACEARAASAADLFEDLIRDPATSPENRRVLLASLGQMGPTALPALQTFRLDPRLGPVLHWALPGALADTGDPAAADEILALYKSDPARGFRVGCLAALGGLLRRAGAGDQPALQPARNLLRGLILERPEPLLAAAAAVAYSRWPAARHDDEVVAATRGRLAATSGDERKGYLQALFGLGLLPDQETRALLEAIAESDQEPAIHRKIARAVLARVAESP